MGNNEFITAAGDLELWDGPPIESLEGHFVLHAYAELSTSLSRLVKNLRRTCGLDAKGLGRMSQALFRILIHTKW